MTKDEFILALENRGACDEAVTYLQECYPSEGFDLEIVLTQFMDLKLNWMLWLFLKMYRQVYLDQHPTAKGYKQVAEDVEAWLSSPEKEYVD